MKVLRTPDRCFEGLADYPFEPNYTTILAADGTELRIHHLDEGPRDGPIVLCMHGQPAWSYLYRKMIPLLVDKGMRVIAPDLVGYGKSDKPGARENYSYQNQVDWMTAWLNENDFTGVTFFGQDWGGLIGLRMIVEAPDRFDRVVISNTGLPYNPDMPEEEARRVRKFRDTGPTPTLFQMGAALQRVDLDGPKAFAYWQKWCWGTEDMPIGFIMSTGQGELSQASIAFRYMLSRLGLTKLRPSTPLGKAYEAPFPGPEYKMGPRAMPMQVPLLPDDPSAEAQRKAWEFYSKFEKPFLCAFTDDDPVTRGSDAPFIDLVPGTKGLPHETIRGGGHFVQEQQPHKLVDLITTLIRTTQ